MWGFIRWVLSDSTTPNPWAQLGIGALVAAPAYGAVSVLWQSSRNKDKMLAEKDRQIAALQEDRVARERLLNERLGPQLAQAVALLSRAPSQFDRALTDASHAGSVEQLSAAIESLDALVKQLRSRPG